MGFFGRLFPYSNLHDLNLDWIMQQIQDLQAESAEALAQILAQGISGTEFHWSALADELIVRDAQDQELYRIIWDGDGFTLTQAGGTPLTYRVSNGTLTAPTVNGTVLRGGSAAITGEVACGTITPANPVDVAHGGTGATTAAAARTALGAMAADTVIPITQGGTGATTAAGARTALGAVSKSGDTMTGNLTVTEATAPSYYLSRTNGKPIGMLYALASSGRVVLRGFNTDGTHYNGFRIPNTSAVTVDADYDILTSKAPVSVAQGGTGATNAEDALTALGAMPANRYAVGGTATSVPANGYQDIPITFATPLPANPRVYTQIDGVTTDPAVAASLFVWTNARTTTGFTIRIFNSSSTQRSPNILWFAIC